MAPQQCAGNIEETLWEGGPNLARDMRDGPYKEVALKDENRTRWEPGLGEEDRNEPGILEEHREVLIC